MIKLRQDVYHAQTRRGLLNNSLTVKVGDVIIPVAATSGVITNATAAVAGTGLFPLGVVVGFSGPNGEVVGQGQSSVGTTTPAQVVTAANNVTAAYTGQTSGGQIYAVYVPITEEMEFSMDLSGVAGTTQAYSALAYVWFNLSDAATVDETSVVQYGTGQTTPLQVFSLGLDPLDTANKTIIAKFAKAAMYNP